MKITKDKDDKAVIDFEGLEVVIEGTDGGLGAINELFNDETVFVVKNGVFKFQSQE